MPGIVGIISRQPAVESERLVKTMVATLRHESFYTTGFFSAPGLGVHAAWVAHENSFAGGQVFQNGTQDVALIFSGECFIEAETKARLKGQGRSFANGGECLIQLYEEQGEKFFAGLNGLFSGLLVDRRRKKVFLFNDRYAMDRIYWHETADAFYFASEAKALLRLLPTTRNFDPEGLREFLALGTTLDEKSLFRGVQRLPGASCWAFENGGSRREKYFSPAEWEVQPPISGEEFESQFQEVFKKILPEYFATDSRIGLALTGGLDTRMIMACMPQAALRPTSYTFTAARGQTLDDRIAASVASACGLEHTLLRLRPDFFSDFGAHADKTVYVTDGAYGIFGAHEIYFHQQARALATLRLTGNYGSEVFRGMSTFKPYGLTPQLYMPEVAAAVKTTGAGLADHKKHPDTFTIFKEIPWNLFGNLAAGRSQISFRTPYLDNRLVKLVYQAPAAVKKSSMPALRLVKACSPALAKIPTDRGFVGDRTGPDILVRRAFAELTFKLDYYSTAGLPRKVSALNPIFRPVVNGLGIAGMHKFLRYGVWFRKELASRVREVLSDPQVRGNGIWNNTFLDNLAAQHAAGPHDYSSEINSVMTLDAIERRLLRGWPKD